MRACALLLLAMAHESTVHAGNGQSTAVGPMRPPRNNDAPRGSNDFPERGESPDQAQAASTGCILCHTGIEHTNMHAENTVVLGCTDCHGGNADITAVGTKGSAEYAAAERKAHIQPRFKENAARGGHPVRAYTRWIEESAAFVRFANPGDLRIAPYTCGVCHAQETRNVKSSMMTHGAMLWGAALYNNGAYPLKNPHFGEAYDIDGKPERLRTFPPPTPEETRTKGVLPYLDPLQRWEVSEPGNMLRVFERGGEKRSEIGNPNTDEPAGQPDLKLSNRGLGTGLRTDPVFLGLQKTRCSRSREPTTSPATTGRVDVRGVTCCTPTTATPATASRPQPSATPATARAATPPSTRMRAVILCSTSSPSRFPPASA